MMAANIPPTGVIARNPDFVALARAFGAAAVRGTHAARRSPKPYVPRSTTRGPTLIEVHASDFSNATL